MKSIPYFLALAFFFFARAVCLADDKPEQWRFEPKGTRECDQEMRSKIMDGSGKHETVLCVKDKGIQAVSFSNPFTGGKWRWLSIDDVNEEGFTIIFREGCGLEAHAVENPDLSSGKTCVSASISKLLASIYAVREARQEELKSPQGADAYCPGGRLRWMNGTGGFSDELQKYPDRAIVCLDASGEPSGLSVLFAAAPGQGPGVSQRLDKADFSKGYQLLKDGILDRENQRKMLFGFPVRDDRVIAFEGGSDHLPGVETFKFLRDALIRRKIAIGFESALKRLRGPARGKKTVRFEIKLD